MARRWWIPWLIVSWCSLRRAEAKFQASSFRLSPRRNSKWKYLSKFGYDVGTGRFEIRVMLSQPKKLEQDATLKVDVFLDEEWDTVEATEDVCARGQHARNKRTIAVKHDGNWSDWVSGSLSQNVRPHIWYFAIHDCDNALQNFTHRLKFEFHATQENASEFSIEMRGVLMANVICLCGFTAFGWYFTQKARVFFRSAEVHPVVWTLASVMIAQYVAQVMHTFHLWKYRGDGKGLKALEVLSEILFMLSQVMQTSLLIIIALGYTLLQSKIGELDLMIPMCFMVGVIHIMLVGFGKIQDDASYKYHENEGGVGYVLLILRLLLYGWFLWAVQSTAAEGGMRLKQFCRQFSVAGSLYFLAYPVIFITAKQFAPYLQNRVMAAGLMLMQMGSNLWLTSLFLRKSEYFKVSTLNSSYLPGGARVGLDKEE